MKPWKRKVDLYAPAMLEFQYKYWLLDHAPDMKPETVAACETLAKDLALNPPPEVAAIVARHKEEFPEGGEALEVMLSAAKPHLLALARKVVPEMREWPVPPYVTGYKPPA